MYIVSNLHNNFEQAIICFHFIVEEQIQSNWVTCQDHTEFYPTPLQLLHLFSAQHHCFISELNYLLHFFLVNFLCNLKVNFHFHLLQNMFYVPPLNNTSLSLSYTQCPVFPLPSIFTAPLPLSTGNHNFFSF